MGQGRRPHGRGDEHVAEFDRAEAEGVLARALWASGEDARARTLAVSALPVYEDAGEQHAATATWLREQLDR